jgi:hypothetical protein
MRDGKPSHGSGKTRFNRCKPRGESWVKLRDQARRAGTWKPAEEPKIGMANFFEATS